MSTNGENVAIIGAGAVVCAACCAGPILGFVAAIGLSTAAGFAFFGTTAVVIGAVAIVIVMRRRRRRISSCAVTTTPVAVEMPSVRTPG